MRRPAAYLCGALVLALAGAPVHGQQSQPAKPASSQNPPAETVLKDYSHGPSAFPDILNPYKPTPIGQLDLENSPRLHDLVHDGVLKLSLPEALAAAIENNLDIAVERYIRPIAEADVLRASSGQAARGVPGASLPAGLSAGALGVGVNQGAGTGGVGAAGGISGGGGAVFVPQTGTFDPSISISTSYDKTSSPLNSTVVAGVPQVTTSSAATSVSFAQMFSQGASVTATVNGIAQNSTQRSLLFNPAVVSRLAAGFNQPLLQGFGSLPNKRFLMVAANDLQTSDQLFREQVITVVVSVEDAYWDLAATQQAVAAAKRADDAANQLVQDTKQRLQIGTAAGIDVVSAQSAAAAADRDLIVANTNLQLQEAQLKTLISKADDPVVDAARIETTDPMPDPNARPLPELKAALDTAMANRPELKTAAADLENENISTRFTKNGLLPNVSTFAMYAGAGLTGDTALAASGLGTSLQQTFDAAYPEYAAGVSANVVLRNRSAQADNLRARLEAQQVQVQVARTRQKVGLEARQAVISLQQGKSQVQAAHDALAFAERSIEAEREKLQLGVSTPYDVILRERDLLTARQADVSAMATYAKALVDFDRATGTTLDQNGITLGQVLTGTATTLPTPSMLQPAAKKEGAR